MSHPLARERLLPRVFFPLAAAALLAAWPTTASLQTCANAYFEIQPTPTAIWNQGWQIPASGTWTEVWPDAGRLHPQFAYTDYNWDGLISHAESFVEAPAGAPWYLAGVGTMYHLTPIAFLEGGGITPIGDPVLAWAHQFWCVTEIRSDGRPWFACPDTLVFLGPAGPERRRVADYLAGGVIGNGPPSMFAFEETPGGTFTWYFRDSLTCGLWVAPDLATPAVRRSWGALKALDRPAREARR